RHFCGRKLLTHKERDDNVISVGFSPDNKGLAIGATRVVRIWDVNKGQVVLTLNGHAHWIYGVAFSPDGRHLATASADRTVKIWDAATGKEVLTFRQHAGWVYGVAYSPDGKQLASYSGGWDSMNRRVPGEVKVWDAATGKVEFTLRGSNRKSHPT